MIKHSYLFKYSFDILRPLDIIHLPKNKKRQKSLGSLAFLNISFFVDQLIRFDETAWFAAVVVFSALEYTVAISERS